MTIAPTPEVSTLAAEAKALRLEMEKARARYYAKAGTYDEMATAAQAFCDAFYRYQVAKVGKSNARRTNWKAVIR